MKEVVYYLAAIAFLGSMSVTAQEDCEVITFDNFKSCNISVALKKTFDKASHGDEVSLYVLGKLYEEGGQSPDTEWVTIDLEKATYYYELSAEKGYMSAQARLSWLYNKYFLPYKEEERDYWACKAAIQGSHQATVNLNNEIAVTKSHETWEAFCADVLPDSEQPASWKNMLKDGEQENCSKKN